MAAQPSRPLTRAEVREVDRVAIEELGVPGVVLMENAGRGLADATLRALAELGAAPAGPGPAIVCGKGNNGGDGFVLARHLELAGWSPRVACCGVLAEATVEGDAAVNRRVLERAGVALREAPTGEALAALLAEWADAPLVVDAVFGTGLAGALREPGVGWVRALDEAAAPKLAVDIPSGLDCDTGQPLGGAVRARWTVTFVAPKAGFAAAGAEAYTGAVEVVAIGCPRQAWAHVT